MKTTDLYLYSCVHLRCIRLCTCIQSNQGCLDRWHSSDSHGYHYCTHQNLKEKGKGLHLRAQFQFYEETERKPQRILAIFLSLFNFLRQGQSIVTAGQKIVLISFQLLVFSQ